jgi:triacylglycerol esterase/lipase EstA (alpha/beta hydrolase family)
MISHSFGGITARGLLKYSSQTGNSAISTTGGLKLFAQSQIGTMSGQPLEQYIALESLMTLNTHHAGTPAGDALFQTIENYRNAPTTPETQLAQTIWNNGFPFLWDASNPADTYTVNRPASYLCLLRTNYGWANNSDPTNQRHLQLRQTLFTDTNWVSGTALYNTELLRVQTGSDVKITNPITDANITTFRKLVSAKYLDNDGIVPVWSSGDDTRSLNRSDPLVIGPRLKNTTRFPVPDADHSLVAQSAETYLRIIDDATFAGGLLDWRLK